MSPRLIERDHLLVERTVTAVTKTQNVRLIDVFLLGPTMIWAGYKTEKDNKTLAFFLAVSGLLTIVYNGDNYLRNQRKLKELV
jgi:hypothetical protein